VGLSRASWPVFAGVPHSVGHAVALISVLLLSGLLALAPILCLLVLVRHRRRALPSGVVVYSDAAGNAKTLVSPHRPLSGKPDYILRLRRGGHVPVEFKSYRYGAQPPHSDLLQVGAYLVLLEDLQGRPPPYGVLRYADRSLRVPYTPTLRSEVLRVLAELVANGDTTPPGNAHPSLCRACPFMPVCDEARTDKGAWLA